MYVYIVSPCVSRVLLVLCVQIYTCSPPLYFSLHEMHSSSSSCSTSCPCSRLYMHAAGHVVVANRFTPQARVLRTQTQSQFAHAFAHIASSPPGVSAFPACGASLLVSSSSAFPLSPSSCRRLPSHDLPRPQAASPRPSPRLQPYAPSPSAPSSLRLSSALHLRPRASTHLPSVRIIDTHTVHTCTSPPRRSCLIRSLSSFRLLLSCCWDQVGGRSRPKSRALPAITQSTPPASSS